MYIEAAQEVIQVRNESVTQRQMYLELLGKYGEVIAELNDLEGAIYDDELKEQDDKNRAKFRTALQNEKNRAEQKKRILQYYQREIEESAQPTGPEVQQSVREESPDIIEVTYLPRPPAKKMRKRAMSVGF